MHNTAAENTLQQSPHSAWLALEQALLLPGYRSLSQDIPHLVLAGFTSFLAPVSCPWAASLGPDQIALP